MTTQPQPQSIPKGYRLTMLPDPPEDEEDTQQQRRHVARADQVLRSWFRLLMADSPVWAGVGI